MGVFLAIPHAVHVDIDHCSGTPYKCRGCVGLNPARRNCGRILYYACIDGTDRHMIARHPEGGKPPSFGVRQQSNRPPRKHRYPALHPRIPLCYALSCIATLSANRTSSVYLHDTERLLADLKKREKAWWRELLFVPTTNAFFFIQVVFLATSCHPRHWSAYSTGNSFHHSNNSTLGLHLRNDGSFECQRVRWAGEVPVATQGRPSNHGKVPVFPPRAKIK